MITIAIIDNKITVDGHAGAGPPGGDIVCASISAILQTFVASIEELTGNNIKSDLRPGKAVIEYQTKDLSEQAKLLIKSFFIGVNGVAGAAPNYVTVIDGRRGTAALGRADKATEKARKGGKESEYVQREQV